MYISDTHVDLVFEVKDINLPGAKGFIYCFLILFSAFILQFL